MSLYLAVLLVHAHHLVAAVLAAPAALAAATPPSAAPTSLFDALDHVKAWIGDLMTHFTPLGAALCGVYAVWGGLQWITAGGSAIQVAAAKKTWWHAGLGLAGVLLATPFVNTIHGMFS